MTKRTPEVPVLVVGGGPAGLVTCLLLAHHGIRSCLVERHPGTSILPRANSINLRTMEILRVLGLEPEVKAAGVNVNGLPLVLDLEALDGPVLRSVPNLNVADPDAPGSPSPAEYVFCTQDVLEPLLLEKLRRSGLCEINFGTQLSSIDQDDGQVRAHLADRDGRARREVTAEYMVAADGADSTTRRALGIGVTGHDNLCNEINVLFEADLWPALGGRRAIIYRLHNRWLEGHVVFRNNDGGNRWTLLMPDFGEPTPERCARLIRRLAGDPHLEVEVLLVGSWVRAALLADRFRDRRVFLTGDAAHRVTPAGGMGMNTAIQSAHNLAWKLAAVLRGWAGLELLDSYETERRPVAARTVELSYRLENDRSYVGRMLGHILGTAYGAGALVPDGTPPPHLDDPVAEYRPTARPGHRAPHAWVSIGGRRRSTIDLFDGRFVLLSADPRWCAAATDLDVTTTVPMVAHVINDEGWARLYGIGEEGAVLVRPDGYVAWRTQRLANNAVEEVLRVMGQVVGHRPRSRRFSHS
jgi:putative polyketide hydroxylase